MFKLPTGLLDFIFPPRESERLLRQFDIKQVRQLYQPHHTPTFISLSNYQNPTVKAAITENKFHNNPQAAQLLGQILQLWLKLQTAEIIMLPIPLSTKRRRQRGYNQVESILEAVPINYYTNLRRTRDTLAQSKLPKAERLTNLEGAFIYQPSRPLIATDAQVVIIDDVITTGATMQAAYQAVRQATPADYKITCLALAH